MVSTAEDLPIWESHLGRELTVLGAETECPLILALGASWHAKPLTTNGCHFDSYTDAIWVLL